MSQQNPSKPSLPPLPCPICKKPVDDEQRGRPGSHYPFCSDRCKLIDLARWLDGKYQIPVEEEDESDPPRADPDR